MFALFLACSTLDTPIPDADPDAPTTLPDLPVDPTPEPPTPDPEVPEPDPDPEPEPEPDPDPQPCSLGPHATSFTLDVPVGSGTRFARVDLPAGYDGTTFLPVVLNFHGLLMSATSHRAYTEMDDAGTARGFIVVHPEAAPEWNVLPGSPDIAFVGSLLDTLADTVCVAEDQVYSTGLSQGGHVSYMLGCHLSDRIAAIAPVAGSDFNVICPSGPVVPNLHIHGTDDWIVDYDGGTLYDSAPETVETWASDVNGCGAAPVVTLAVGDVTCETRTCAPDDDTVLCSVDGGGHTWPGAAPNFVLGTTTDDIDANTAILDFFERFRR